MLRCKDVMTADPFICRETDSISRCAEQMAVHRIGFLPVVDRSRRVIGVVTDRDLVVRGLARRLDAHTTPVGRVMSEGDLVCCKATDPLAVAEQAMAEHRKARIPVVDDFGECVGVISLSDIAQADEPTKVGSLLGQVTTRESHALH